MSAGDPAEAIERVRATVQGRGVDLLVLFGSRARGQEGGTSDWDFGYLAGEEFDADDLLPGLVRALGDDRIDLVDLRRAGALVRFRAARDGIVIYQSQPERFERFQLEAASFWCDIEPVLHRAYDRLLDVVAR